MGRWFTSDTHFGHGNIIRYCHRPYRDADEMNADLVARHNALVGHDDEVWWLGDIAMGDRRANLKFVRRCHGRKFLVVGNHDSPFTDPSRNKATSSEREQIYRDAGFERIMHGTNTLDLVDGTHVLVSHFPYEADSRDVIRHRSARPTDTGGWLLCGHIHEKWRQQSRQINVGVDAWGGRPVPESEIITLIAAGPADREPIAW